MPVVIFLLVVIILILCPWIIGAAAVAAASVIYLLSKLIIPICIFIALLISMAILEKLGTVFNEKIKTTILCLEIGFVIFLCSLIHYTGAFLFSDILFIVGMLSLMMFGINKVNSELNLRERIIIRVMIFGYIYISFYELAGITSENSEESPSIITLALFGILPLAYLISDFFKCISNSDDRVILTKDNLKYLKSLGKIKIILYIMAVVLIIVSATLIKQLMYKFPLCEF